MAARDTACDGAPDEWALHAWSDGTKGRREALPEVARTLLAAGAEATEAAVAPVSRVGKETRGRAGESGPPNA